MANPVVFNRRWDRGWDREWIEQCIIRHRRVERIKFDMCSYHISMNNGIPKSVIIPDEFLENINCDKVVISASTITRVDNLPSGKIKSLCLIGEFNNSIDNLPLGIEKLYLGEIFNKSVDLIPISVKFLSLGYKFNQPLNNLPPGLETLEIGSYKYTHSLSCLPASCKTVIRRGEFKRHLNDLPDTVETIIIHNTYGWIEEYAVDFRPPTELKKMIIYHPINSVYHPIRGLYYEFGSLDKYEIIKNKIPKSVIFEIINEYCDSQ